MKEAIKETVISDIIIKCDSCHNEIKGDLGFISKDTKIHICSACGHKIPDDVKNSLNSYEIEKNADENWKFFAAKLIIQNIYDGNESFLHNEGIADLNKGTWAVFGNDEAEHYALESIEKMMGLKEQARYHEHNYKHFPMYLMATLIDGKLRHFIKKWDLIDLTDETTDRSNL